MARTKWTNQFRKSRNHYPPSGDLLDNGQKARICILAREAFLQTELVQSNENFIEWRRQEQLAAVGKESLRDCTQADYLKIRAHFEDLAGEPGRAVKTHLRDAVKDKSIAMLKLREACAERGLALAYPGAICQRQYKHGLEDATTNQIWQLVFTVRNRRKAKAIRDSDPF